MALKAQVTAEEFATFNPVIQKEYVQVEGQEAYQLAVEEVGGLQLADVGKMQTALDRERQNVKATSAKLKAYDGIDPAAAREALALREKFEKGELSDKDAERLKTLEKQLAEKYDGQRKQLVESHSAEKNNWSQREAKLLNQVRESQINSVVDTAIAAHEGIPALLKPLLLSRVKLEEDGDTWKRTITGDNGQPMLSRKPGSLTENMDLDEYVGMLKSKPEFAGAFKGSGSSGGGSSNGANGNGANNKGAAGAVTLTKTQANDVRLYREARARAEKLGTIVQVVEG